LRLTVTLTPDFGWDPKVSGSSEPFWVWVGDSGREHVYHSEYVLVPKPKLRRAAEPVVLALTIPCAEPLPAQYLVHVLSDRWVGVDEVHAVSFRHLVLPDLHPPHTDLLMLTPLPVAALQHAAFEQLYAGKLTHFNPIQTQVFHTLYRTDRNVLLGAPTSSGKTLVAELALLRVLNQRAAQAASSIAAAAAAPGEGQTLAGSGVTGSGSGCVGKIVYVAPLKALARERVKDWRLRLGGQLGLSVLELTGDVTPDPQSLRKADVIITTPEKWDGVSRGWRSRDYVRAVQLVVIDEIHLLGEERGAVLEVIVSRMRHMAARLGTTVRLLGLSTALANARDLGDWLGVDPRPGRGLYNFRPSVRPVPMEVHIRGFPGPHYCPRMATMNKPTYSAILEHSPRNPVLVFVASRRQTRLTALDLISFCAAADHPKQWLHLPDADVEAVAATCSDDALKHTLLYGVGLHHAGLSDHDRTTVEELFVHGKVQVLVCTSTLAWGVNFPARLVVVKGTEFFDGKLGR
jgi:activating signal cointegrator complex subunit 3